MTQEEKQLLLKDLCARIPYSVTVRVEGEKYFNEIKEPYITSLSLNNYILDYNDVTIIPFLRPMLSMTEEERDEYEKANDLDTIDSSETLRKNMEAKSRVRISKWYHGADWLNAHHFDYRGLIEKGLALEAPEGMYKTE